eukprot:Hpha_TRINITY_DN19634_c0_g1::TRINITY_DN19634_c0_g1_i1::g.186117::m.186117
MGGKRNCAEEMGEDGHLQLGSVDPDERADPGRPDRQAIVTRILVPFVACLILALAIFEMSTTLDDQKGQTHAPTSPDGRVGYCELMSGGFAFLIQVALLICACVALIIKRQRERPRRPLKVWAMDASKQAFSSGAAHLIGMSVAYALGEATAKKHQCGWYLVTFTTDTSLGVLVAWRLLRKLEKEARKRGWLWLAESGSYRDPARDHDPQVEPSVKVWLAQLACFCVIVLLARFCCATFLFAMINVLKYPAEGLTSLFEGHPKAYLTTVMLVGPGLMNLVQALVQDQFLKRD